MNSVIRKYGDKVENLVLCAGELREAVLNGKKTLLISAEPNVDKIVTASGLLESYLMKHANIVYIEKVEDVYHLLNNKGKEYEKIIVLNHFLDGDMIKNDLVVFSAFSK